jgi:hypothetical protein
VFSGHRGLGDWVLNGVEWEAFVVGSMQSNEAFLAIVNCGDFDAHYKSALTLTIPPQYDIHDNIAQWNRSSTMNRIRRAMNRVSFRSMAIFILTAISSWSFSNLYYGYGRVIMSDN